MKVKRILLTIMLLITPIAISGCDNENNENNKITMNDFMRISNNIDDIVVFVHKETRVMYMFAKGTNRGGLTVMLDANGKPLLYEGEIE